MPEEREVATRRATGDSDEGRRAAAVGRVIIIAAGLAVIAAGFYVVLYVQERAWQILVDIAGLAAGMACLAPAGWLVRRRRTESATYWILAALLIVYSSSEAAWSDVTLPLAVSFVLLVILVATVARARRWTIWLGGMALYLLVILLINQFGTWGRFPILEKSPITQLINIPLALLVVWQVIRAAAFNRIRTRLLAAFVLLVLLPTVVISVVSAVLGFRSVQQQAFDRLELVAELKKGEVDDWVDSLQFGLIAALTERDTPMFVQRLLQPGVTVSERMVYTTLEGFFQRYINRTRQFDGLFLLNLEGQAIVATDVMPKRFPHSDQAYFTEGLRGPLTLTMPESPLSDQPLVIAAQPATDEADQVLGVLVGYVSTDRLDELVLRQAGLGTTGEIYIVGPDHALLTKSGTGEQGDQVQTQGADIALGSQTDGEGLYANYEGRSVLGVYRWLPRLGVALLVEEDQSEVSASTYQVLILNLGAGVALVLIAAGASLLVTRSIASPLVNLAEMAAQVAAGNLEQVVEIEREDEIGAVARAFNDMTAQVRDVVSNLEQRVAERTRDLEQRSAYLEASAEVARTASSILDMDQLTRQMVELIRQRFNLYYVGLFMVDEAGEWAILRSGTGEAGQMMLERGHRIRVGEGTIGWSVANAQARIALDVGEDAVRLTTAALPRTRSEAALPLRSRGQVLGALTLQSDQPAAFSQDAIIVFQTVADQVAVALDNARLFAESRAALEAVRRAHGELSREAWTELLKAWPDVAYVSGKRGVTQTRAQWRPEMKKAQQTGGTVRGDGGDGEAKSPLAVPIKVRGHVIGVLDTYKPAEAGEWTSEEIALLEALTDQLGQALESARLYRDTQRRAARERLTREITDKMRRASSVEGIVQTAVDEIFSSMGTSRAFVRLVPPPSHPDDGGEGT